MALRKHGVGEITATEGSTAKTAAQSDWTEEDQKALEEENKS